MEDKLFQIGAVAERVDLSLRTIRFYDEAGIVVPSARSAGGFRLYTEADIDRLIQVKAMKPLGFTLDETKELMELRDRLGAGEPLSRLERAVLADYSERADAKFRKRQRQLADARRLTDALRREAAAVSHDPDTEPA
ncbi:MAG: MerR family transcriptional regulator [Acidimicrobiales bacterium]